MKMTLAMPLVPLQAPQDRHLYIDDLTERRSYEEERTIPCLNCSLRGRRDPPLHNIRFKIPFIDIGNKQVEGDHPRGVSGKKSVRGRGRAVSRKNRAPAVLCRARPSSALSTQEDSNSSVSGSIPSSRSLSPVTLGCTRSSSVCSQVTAVISSSSSPSEDILYPVAANATIASSLLTEQVDISERLQPLSAETVPVPNEQHSSSFTEEMTKALRQASTYGIINKGSSLRSQAPKTTVTIEPEQKTVVQVPKSRKKTKYTRLDLQEPYETYQSELLVGIPAGSENSNNIGCEDFGKFDRYRLGSEDVPCMMAGYRPKETPKVCSILEFPGLKSKQNTSNFEINFMNTVPNKKCTLNMKSIAAGVSNSKETSDGQASCAKVAEIAEVTIAPGCTVIIDNIPQDYTSTELSTLVIQPYGRVSQLTTTKTGNTYTATVIMEKADEAKWVRDTMDGVELLPGIGSLSVRVI